MGASGYLVSVVPLTTCGTLLLLTDTEVLPQAMFVLRAHQLERKCIAAEMQWLQAAAARASPCAVKKDRMST